MFIISALSVRGFFGLLSLWIFYLLFARRATLREK